jgi:hypothetical protein
MPSQRPILDRNPIRRCLHSLALKEAVPYHCSLGSRPVSRGCASFPPTTQKFEPWATEAQIILKNEETLTTNDVVL